MILFVGLTDYVIRNLLRSSFAQRARHLQLRLHGLVYPEIFDAYSKMLETEINMTSEPQDLVRLFDCASANLERIHFRANLYQRSRVNCRTFRAKRRNSSAEQATPLALRLKFEAALLFGKMGGMLGWERSLEEKYFRELAQSDYVKNHCVPYLTRMRPSVLVSASADGFPDTTFPGIPYPVVIMVALFVIVSVLLSRTSLGRHIYAVGSNAEAARLSGVNVQGVKLFTYVLSGALAGVTGCVLMSRLVTGQPNEGVMYELDAIASSVIGGTSLMGGVGTISGTAIGAFVIGVLRNGLNMNGVSSFIQQIIIGVVILGTVWIDQLRNRKR